MNMATSSLYVILGATLRALIACGETPQDIHGGIEAAFRASLNADPVMAEASRVYAETMMQRAKETTI